MDKAIIFADRALKVLTHEVVGEKQDNFDQSIPLMRANYAGEVAAQGLYLGAWFLESHPYNQIFYTQAIDEEFRHLDWCGLRLAQLGGSVSVFNPVWFFGACIMGMTSQAMGAKYALGFVYETEKQVLSHLRAHLKRLPQLDICSKRIIKEMIKEESEHADAALIRGGVGLPRFIRASMHQFGQILTQVSERI